MSRTHWHTLKDGNSVTVARQLPARFDVCAETVLTRGSATRIAHQIRQDMWRALRRVRGFSPVVEIQITESGLHVRAGGRVDGAIAKAHIEATIDGLLSSTPHRRRWEWFASSYGEQSHA